MIVVSIFKVYQGHTKPNDGAILWYIKIDINFMPICFNFEKFSFWRLENYQHEKKTKLCGAQYKQISKEKIRKVINQTKIFN